MRHRLAAHGEGRPGHIPQPAGAGRHHHPGGKLVFHASAALAGCERDPVRERTSAGLAAAGAPHPRATYQRGAAWLL